ncbi:hypothetical protein CUD01_26090 [Cellulomonas uda]|uniref:Uncharacterized protein n=1 Tax=Cellulomonas uda TaxID=1714 RepID=A0A4Y3KGG9_CELUD|nr:hypothetical protein CUD01_26090 [Cellulomonas uda]
MKVRLERAWARAEVVGVDIRAPGVRRVREPGALADAAGLSGQRGWCGANRVPVMITT